MGYLIFVSLVWAFSFGLIKGTLADVDPNFVAFARMLLSLLVFLPFLRVRGAASRLVVPLVGIGAIQFGVMYVAYIHAYRYLLAHQVALATIFTPIWVALLHGAMARRVPVGAAAGAVLAIAGAWIVVGADAGNVEIREGFLLVQVSNLAFAFGQVAYRKLLRAHPEIRGRDIFALLYLGAVAVTLAAAAMTTKAASLALDAREIGTLLYLGVLASGIGFFLWNHGARTARVGTLAVLNNLKIPLAVACSLLVFGEEANLTRLLAGGGLLVAAVLVAEATDPRDAR